jgi:hypothetical protein
MTQFQRTFAELQDIMGRVAVSLPVAEASQRKTGLREAVQDTQATAYTAHNYALDAAQNQQAVGIVVDPGGNPTVPTGLALTATFHGFAGKWNQNPTLDYVVSYDVSVTPTGGSETVTSSKFPFFTPTNLTPGVVHSVKVRAVNQWGRAGSYTASQNVTPQYNASEQIDMTAVAQAGRLQGLLPNINLDTITDPTKYGANTVQAIALAAGQNSNVLSFNEAEYENWADGTVWPPSGIASIVPSGWSAIVSAINGRKWLQINASASGTIYPRSDFTQRGANPGCQYIYSFWARNTGASAITLTPFVHNASDAAGTGVATLALGSAVSIPNDGTETQVWVGPFTVSSAKPYLRFGITFSGADSSIYIGKHQLEAVPAGKTQPSAYSVPASSFGVMSGYFLATMDFTTCTAVIGTEAVGSALISNLVADKITGGTINTTTINVTSDVLCGPGVKLNSNGLSLVPATDVTFGAQIAYKITTGGGTEWGEIYFTDLDFGGRSIIVDGHGPNVSGQSHNITLRSTSGDTLAESKIDIVATQGGTGDIVITPAGKVQISGDCTITGTFSALGLWIRGPAYTHSNNALANGATDTLTHGLGHVPTDVFALYSLDNTSWAPLPTSTIALTITSTTIAITNASGVSIHYVLYIYQ